MASETMAIGRDGRRIAIGAAATVAGTILLWMMSHAIDRPIGGRAAWESFALPIHIGAVAIALPLGGYVLWRRKGDATHRLLGRVWAGAMMVAALSSFWLRSLSGGFSFIHLLSVLTLVSIPLAVHYARTGRIQAHLRTMRGVYIGLVVAGIFSLAPERVIGSALFG